MKNTIQMMTPYEILEINKYSSEDEIRNAYRKCLLKAHPDHGGSVEEFDAVRIAYIKVKNKHVKNRLLTVNMTVELDALELKYCQGETSSFIYDDTITFDVFVPNNTQFNDTVVINNILPNTILRIKFKEYNG